MRTARLRRLTPLLVLALFAGAIWLLHRELAAYHYEDVRRALRALTRRQIEIALGLTAISYLLLTGYDALALRYLGRPLSYRRTALASFLGYAFAHNIGFSVLGGAAPRYRLYASWGLPPGEISLLIGFTAATFWVGVCAVTGTALLVDPVTFAAHLHLPASIGHSVGAALLGVVAVALVVPWFWRRPLTIRGWTVPPPRPGIAAAQVVVGAVDWLVAAAVLWVLLPHGMPISFSHFAALFVVAQVAGVSSHVPGGLGVFETVILLALTPHGHSPALVGALLVYRVVYYVLPLALATLLLVAFEIRQRGARLAAAGAVAGRWVSEMAPRVMALAVFAAGAVLLFSGAGRRHANRLDLLREVLPLSVLEASHFLASLIGLGLILLASGLQRRLDAAYHLAVVLLTAGAVLALLKGLDYEESLLLLAMLGVLVPCRGEFDRHASLIGERFTVGWGVAVTVVLVAAAWFGFFVHKHTEYSRELWWEFSFFGDAPRFLRAGVGVGVVAAALAVWHLLSPSRLRPAPPDADSLAAARAVVARSPVAASHLALLGDKSFLFNADRSAFLMYAVSGRSCVAMGDPVGTTDNRRELIWDFLELCDRHDTWPVFYEASAAALPHYLEAGLSPLKFGEEALVSLPAFSLEGSARKQQRYVLRSSEREGAEFEVRPPDGVPELIPQLRAVSDTWLREKRTREKGFSLGNFDPGYLAQCPLAVVRWRGEIVAFANLWCAAERAEVSPDLMRYLRAAPPSVMEYLFLKILLWAKDEGYAWMNLGMAPLAGLEARSAAPLWNRVGALAFRYGEQFYNFQGLRQFKSKFDPEWRPKYLVYSGGLVLPRVLANVASLVSSGLRGVVAK
ncbi:bifunctional lysylphosphatidylglycerol flippase/synthetase MprF [bacterium]|nr:bifunctional lysylphosphatidylglycerol flippase/synthetase MprF [bacterium]